MAAPVVPAGEPAGELGGGLLTVPMAEGGGDCLLVSVRAEDFEIPTAEGNR